ncbi:hypothetical protein BASA81_007135 [Batrachochytrium salamandrivorans]|nr:hypothetical protein BASA81_007135 [Batrachochytrium salamandrivorans]
MSPSSKYASSRSSAVSSPPPQMAVEMEMLEASLKQSFALFQVLLHLVPNLQAERRLRFVWAMIDYQQTPSKSFAAHEKRRFIYDYFIKKNAEFAIELPLAVRLRCQLVLRGKFIPAYRHALANLCLLPEILCALPGKFDKKSSFATQSTSSFSSLDLVVGAEPNQVHTLEINVEAGELNEVIKNKVTRRHLVSQLGTREDLVRQVQFIPAVDHFLNLHDNNEQREMGLKIIELFLQNGGGVQPVLGQSVDRAITVHGKLERLAMARVEVLNKLCENEVVLAALRAGGTA